MPVLIVNCQMPDKRRWTTTEQRNFLDSYIPQYLEVQASRKYRKFWPGLYQDWFEKFPEPEPEEDDPTESEDNDPDLESHSESDAGKSGDAAGSKRKWSSRKAKAKKLKVFYLWNFFVIHADNSRRRWRLPSLWLRRERGWSRRVTKSVARKKYIWIWQQISIQILNLRLMFSLATAMLFPVASTWQEKDLQKERDIVCVIVVHFFGGTKL